MHEIIQEIIERHMVRRTNSQKSAFIEYLSNALSSEGIQASIEQSQWPLCRNIVIGDPVKAKYIVTAHYDTPVRSLIPNFVAPVSGLYFGILLFALAGAAYAGMDLKYSGSLAYRLAVYGAVAVSMLQFIFGKPNEPNYNDNTSGVACVLETLLMLEKSHRSQYCFVLFDLEEAWLFGSRRFAGKHSKSPGEILINIDCVSDGDHIMLFPSKGALRADEWEKAKANFATDDWRKTIIAREKGIKLFSSDNISFKNSVAIGAFRKSPVWGYYISRIHTKKDIIFDERNIAIISNAIACMCLPEAKANDVS